MTGNTFYVNDISYKYDNLIGNEYLINNDVVIYVKKGTTKKGFEYSSDYQICLQDEYSKLKNDNIVINNEKIELHTETVRLVKKYSKCKLVKVTKETFRLNGWNSTVIFHFNVAGYIIAPRETKFGESKKTERGVVFNNLELMNK
jgi:hypothetical protein